MSVHSLRRSLVALCLLILAQTPFAVGEDQDPSAEPHQLSRTDAEIIIDGKVEEAAWEGALRLFLRYETRPGENTEAPVETEAFLTYDDRKLYVAFKAHDPDPDQIRAHLSDRDTAWSDDFVGLVIDPFNDERRAFEIFANPLGVQMDAFLDDLLGREDPSWDAIWDSAGRITATGYEVEIAIPFHQLRFPRIDGVQTWGIDLLRFYPRNQRYRLSLQPLSRDIDCYLCQISKIEGLEGITPGRNLEIVPTLTGTRTDENEELSDEPLPEGDFDTEAGLTVKWGFTPNMILNGTINPDFSQVEADVAQLTVNERFAIFFPERRPFFLEGADFFDTPFNAVFTRNVFDPEWGAKVSGKEGKNALGAFIARDEVTNLLFPGSQESDGDQFDFATVDAVARYRRDLPRNSSIGVLGTSRDGGDYSNRLAAVDGVVRLSDVDSITYQYLYSQTEYPTEIAEDFDQPLGVFSDDAYGLSYEHDGRNWGWWATHHNIGTDFRADMGFIPQVDLVQGAAGTRYIWWAEEGDRWTRAEVGARWNQEWDQAGQQLERLYDVWAEMGGPSQSWLWLNYNDKNEFFDGVEFPQKFFKTFFRIEPSGTIFFRLFARYGDGVDYANTEPGKLLVLEPLMRLNLGRRVKVDLSHDLQRFDRDEGRLFDANLTRLRLVYQFNRRTFVRLVTQYFDIRKNLDLYVDEDEQAHTRSLFNQILFSYTVNPQTVIFVGYSDSQEADDVFALTPTSRTLFVKLGYAWIP